MANVLFLYESDMPTVSELKLSFKRMFQDNVTNIIYKKINEVRGEDISWTDLLFLVRPNNILLMKIALKASKAGKQIIFFMDDDLFCLPANIASIPWRQRALKKILSLSNILISSSPDILNKYKDCTKDHRCVRMDTAVSDEAADSALHINREGETIKLVFAAGKDHEGPFHEYIRPILYRLSDDFGKKISFSFVGVHPDIRHEDYNFNVRFYKGMPLLEYREFMKKHKFDIGIAPLDDNAFTRCKYFNKYIEYSMVGVVGIYSNCVPYTYAVKDGYNGFLAENSPDSWYNVICNAINDGVLRRRYLKNALDDLKNNFNDRSVKGKLVEEIPELIRPHKSDYRKYSLKIDRLCYKLCRGCDLIYLVFFYLKRTGVKGVWRRYILRERMNE